MSQTRMEPSLAKRFRSGRACLNFAHTAETPDWVEPELIYDVRSLERWLAYILDTAGIRAEPSDLASAHELRAALLRLARNRAAGKRFNAADVKTLNGYAAAESLVPRLAANGTAAPLVASATAALSAIARDAIDLFSGPLGDRVRVCASPECAYLFVDASRPGERRWCSMQRCGNLAKVHAHREAKSRAASK